MATTAGSLLSYVPPRISCRRVALGADDAGFVGPQPAKAINVISAAEKFWVEINGAPGPAPIRGARPLSNMHAIRAMCMPEQWVMVSTVQDLDVTLRQDRRDFGDSCLCFGQI